MLDPKASAHGNLASSRIDLQLIANRVEPGTKVLDIGCGDGVLLDLLVTDRQVDARGLELSQKGVNACVARGLSVVQGNADTDLSYYPDNGFDTVILSQTLQATQKPLEVLSEMARIGERLIVSIPNFGHWRVRLDLLLKGRMPITGSLAASWYETANIHLCTCEISPIWWTKLGCRSRAASLCLTGARAKYLASRALGIISWRSKACLF